MMQEEDENLSGEQRAMEMLRKVHQERKMRLSSECFVAGEGPFDWPVGQEKGGVSTGAMATRGRTFVSHPSLTRVQVYAAKKEDEANDLNRALQQIQQELQQVKVRSLNSAFCS